MIFWKFQTESDFFAVVNIYINFDWSQTIQGNTNIKDSFACCFDWLVVCVFFYFFSTFCLGRGSNIEAIALSSMTTTFRVRWVISDDANKIRSSQLQSNIEIAATCEPNDEEIRFFCCLSIYIKKIVKLTRCHLLVNYSIFVVWMRGDKWKQHYS